MADTLACLEPIETERFCLRPFELLDAPALQEITDDPAITGMIHFLPEPFTLENAEDLIDQGRTGRDRFIGVWNRVDDQLVGVIGVHLHGADEIEIGYWIRSSLHGRGIATEATGACLQALRSTFPSRRIIAECRSGNTISWHLLQKLGFHAEGQAGRRPDGNVWCS